MLKERRTFDVYKISKGWVVLINNCIISVYYQSKKEAKDYVMFLKSR